jgi:hypothetical protein
MGAGDGCAKTASHLMPRISAGKKAITELLSRADGAEDSLRYVQTLSSIDRVIRGWGNSFAYRALACERLDIEV